METHYRPVETHGISRRAEILAPEGTTFGCGRRGGAPPRVATRIDRRSLLSVVDERVARAVARARIEHPVGTELDRPDRVAGVLLAPTLDEHLLGAGHDVARGL